MKKLDCNTTIRTGTWRGAQNFRCKVFRVHRLLSPLFSFREIVFNCIHRPCPPFKLSPANSCQRTWNQVSLVVCCYIASPFRPSNERGSAAFAPIKSLCFHPEGPENKKREQQQQRDLFHLNDNYQLEATTQSGSSFSSIRSARNQQVFSISFSIRGCVFRWTSWKFFLS